MRIFNIPILRILVFVIFAFIITSVYYNTDLQKISRGVKKEEWKNEHKVDNDDPPKTGPQQNVTQKMRYILQWTSPKTVPFVYMGRGQKGFIDRNCSYTNCYVTSDRKYLKDITEFDVIVFSGPELKYNDFTDKPEKRSPHQKYVFASIESAENYPICSEEFDGFFNWTWTYRLDSEARWGYFNIKDSEGKLVGPRKEMNWIKNQDMKPVLEDLKKILKGKTKAAAWFVSNCGVSRRDMLAKQLVKQLNTYGLALDVYGKCGKLKCDRSDEEKCNKMLEKDYYFYLVFENSLSEDYITEKLLHAVQYSTIPVIYSGANLSRFLPEGSYLDARALGPRKLAAAMNELIRDSEKYGEYFKWRNHYSYHRQPESPDTNEYCSFCALPNNEEMVKKKTVYYNFKQWWTPSYVC